MKSLDNQKGIVELIVLSIIGVTLVGGTATVVASCNALPGDTLYGVKRASESVRLATALTKEDKAKLKLTQLQARLSELEQLHQKSPNHPKLDETVADVDTTEAELEDDVDALKDSRAKNELEAETEHESDHALVVLSALLDKVPDAAKPAIQHAMTEVQKHIDKKKTKSNHSAKTDAAENKSSNGSSHASDSSGKSDEQNSDSTDSNSTLNQSDD